MNEQNVSEQNENEKNEKNLNKIKEAIQEYYKLKYTYENNYDEQYIKPLLKMKGLSMKEKRSKFQKLPKPKCINCKRNVGTIFLIKGSDDFKNHVYNAYCGDTADPCPFNIKIIMPNVQLIDKLLLENESSVGSINITKLKIIKAKNDLLFGYLKEDKAFKEFEELTTELETETKTYEYLLEKFILSYDNPVQREQLKKEKVELGLNIQQFKEMIAEFNKTNNPQIVYNAVEVYINEIEPKLKKIEKMAYAYNKVEYNENDDTYILVQKKYTIEQQEIEFDNPKIESFIIGTINNKTLKQKKTVTTKPNTTTRKRKSKKDDNKGINLIIEEPEEEKEEKEEPEPEPEPEPEEEKEPEAEEEETNA